ncbi:MAG: putative transporter ATP-binding protein [Francisellaceae bacterium]|nr:putative transporter ATP-binding protein [Francisellaceae bacterium]
MFVLPKNLTAFLWHFVKPYRKSFILMLLAMLFTAIHTSLSQYFVKEIINEVEAYKPDSHLFQLIFWPAILFIVLSQLMDLCWRLYDYLIIKVMPVLKADITLKMFAYIQQHSYSYYQHQLGGSLANKINDMARGAETIIMLAIEPMFVQLASLIIGAFSMYLIHPYFAIALLTWSVIFMGVVILLSKKAHHYSSVFSESRSECMGKIVDATTNIMSTKLFARTRFEIHYLQKYLKDTIVKDRNLQNYMLKMKVFQGLSVTLLLAAMLALLIYMREQNRVTVGDFAFILTLSIYIMQGLWYLASHFVMFSQELGMCSQALSLITVPHGIVDVPNAKELKVSRGEIYFDNVSFQYQRNRNLFQNKTIKIEGGQKVGLVGFSGSGKTTFVNLILRFFDISAGKILIDGQDISQVTQDSLRSNIAIIPQDPMLFHRTLIENIRYGRLDATDEEIIEAAKKAHCHEFILKLEDGYNTMVGERGIKLSGGQRQRIAIARAILKNAPILILDEATSALDSVTEKQIHESVEYLMKNRTSIVVAHRLSTLSDMDRILVFKGGEVIEDGDHFTLMELKVHYAKLWDMQAGGFLPEKAEEE